MLCYVMLCYVMLCYIKSYHIMPYHIMSYHIISHHIISYHIISYHIISSHIKPCFCIIPYYRMLHYLNRIISVYAHIHSMYIHIGMDVYLYMYIYIYTEVCRCMCVARRTVCWWKFLRRHALFSMRLKGWRPGCKTRCRSRSQSFVATAQASFQLRSAIGCRCTCELRRCSFVRRTVFRGCSMCPSSIAAR